MRQDIDSRGGKVHIRHIVYLSWVIKFVALKIAEKLVSQSEFSRFQVPHICQLIYNQVQKCLQVLHRKGCSSFSVTHVTHLFDLLIYTELVFCGRLVDSNLSVHCVNVFLYMLFFPKYSIFNFKKGCFLFCITLLSWVSCNLLGTSFQCLNHSRYNKKVSDHVTNKYTGANESNPIIIILCSCVTETP